MAILMPEVETKVINLLKESKKLMKHGKRSYLKARDIDLALKKIETGKLSYSLGAAKYEYTHKVVDGVNTKVLTN